VCLLRGTNGDLYITHVNFCIHVPLTMSITLAFHVSPFSCSTLSWEENLASAFCRSSTCELADVVAYIVRTHHLSVSYSSMLTVG